MKRYVYKLSLILSLNFLIFSCSKDEQAVEDQIEEVVESTDETAVTPIEKVDNLPETSFGNDASCSFKETTNFRSEFVRLCNAYRKSIGLKELIQNEAATHVAFKHTTHMICKNDFDHSNFQESFNILVKTVNARAMSENIIKGFNTPQKMLDGWLNSPGHRENIENPNSTHTGFGVIKHENVYWATQIFYN